jgi:iron complex outermembrane recepter protein
MLKASPFAGLFIVLSLFLSVPLWGQFPGGGPGSMGGGRSGGTGDYTGPRPTIGHIFGKVVDTKKKGIEFASVALYTLKSDSLVGGQLTEANGEFSLDNLPFGGFKLKITYVGYTPIEQKVIILPKSLEQDLGNIVMAEDTKTLGDVTVTAEKSTIELKPDRKVFNVEKDLSSRGGTGIDVMKNIPGVSTDADGNVTLRNNTPIIYVDGKPTTLTLDQIPADQIEKVEVITNPSAKFEADAAGGIINVVLKKNHLPGYNGMITAAVGTNDQYNGMALFNVREKKFGFMLNYNINGSTNRTLGSTQRTNLNSDTATGYLHQSDMVINKRLFQTARVGFDGYINNHNTLSLTQSGTFGSFNTIDNGALDFDSSDANLAKSQNIIQNQDVSFRNFTTNLSLTHTYTKPDKQWSLDFSYNHSYGTTNYLNSYSSFTAQGLPIPYSLADSNFNQQYQTQNGYQHTDMITAQWDFEDPINSSMKLEFGFRSSFQRQYSTLSVANIDSSVTEVSPSLSSTYRTDNLINAAYITFSHTVKSFSYQLGLRFEETYFNGREYYKSSSTGNDTSTPLSYAYPSTPFSLSSFLNCFFPSIMLSQKFGTQHELQFNITRKIQRPNFRQIAPFISNSTPAGYSIGNPGLQPEFQNKAELNYDLTIPKLTWLSSVYGSYNQEDITGVTYPDPSNPDLIVSSFANAAGQWRYGWENTFKVSPVKPLDITADVNLFYTSVQASVEGVNFSSSGYSYVVKGIISYKFPLNFVAQVNGSYESPRIIAQGNTLPMYYFDCSLSKDLGPVTLNLAVSDVLNSRSFGSYNDAPSYIQTQIRRRDQRYARLGVSFKFGKMDGSLFKKKQKKDPNQGNPGDDMGF